MQADSILDVAQLVRAVNVNKNSPHSFFLGAGGVKADPRTDLRSSGSGMLTYGIFQNGLQLYGQIGLLAFSGMFDQILKRILQLLLVIFQPKPGNFFDEVELCQFLRDY